MLLDSGRAAPWSPPPRRGTARPSTAGWRCRPSRVPPPIRALPGRRRTLGRRRHDAAPRRPQRRRCPQIVDRTAHRAVAPATRCAGERVTDRRPARAPRAARSWTLVAADGALDVEVTACDDTASPTSCRSSGASSASPCPGLWAGSTAAGRRPAAHAPELAPRCGPRPRRTRDRRRRRPPLERPGTACRRRARTPAGAIPLGAGTARARARDGRAACGSRIRTSPGGTSQIRVGGGAISVADSGSTNGSRLDDAPNSTTASALASGRPAPARRERPDGQRHRRSRPRGAGGAPGWTRLQSVRRTGCACPAAEREVVVPRGRRSTPPGVGWPGSPSLLPAVGGVLHGLAAAHAHVPVLRPAQPGGGARAPGSPTAGRAGAAGRRDRAAYARRPGRGRGPLGGRGPRRRPGGGERRTRTWRRSPPRRAAGPHLLWSRRSDRRRCPRGPGRHRAGADTGHRGVDGGRPRGTRRAEHLPVVRRPAATGGGLASSVPGERHSGVCAPCVAQLTALHAPDGVDAGPAHPMPTRFADWTWARWLPHLAPGAVHVGHRSRRRTRALDAGLTRLARSRPLRSRVLGRGPGRRAVPGGRPAGRRRSTGTLDGRSPPRSRAARDAGVVLWHDRRRRRARCRSPSMPRSPLAGETGDARGAARRRTLRRPHRRRWSTGSPPAAAGDSPATSPASRPAASGAALPRRGAPARAARLAASPWRRRTAYAGAGRDARDRLRRHPGPLGRRTRRASTCAGTVRTPWSPAPPDRASRELLQTLIAGLALHHPPDRCSFLLVDYKGGAAFAEAAAPAAHRRPGHRPGRLDHRTGAALAGRGADPPGGRCSPRTASRTSRRCPTTSHWPGWSSSSTSSPRSPRSCRPSCPGLVAIAQRGRSLGIHLVLATQRPGGVVSPEIRANCTLRICLRTTDEADSRDVLGTPEAAHLPVRPARAGRSCAAAAARRASSRWPAWRRPPAGRRPGRPRGPPLDLARRPRVRRRRTPRPGARDLARLAAALTARTAESAAPPRRTGPGCRRCPTTLDSRSRPRRAAPGRHARSATRLRHRPARPARPSRRSEPLEVDLAEGGGWLAVGGPRSGRTTLLRGRAAPRRSPGSAPTSCTCTSSSPPAAALAAEAAGAAARRHRASRGATPLRTVRLVRPARTRRWPRAAPTAARRRCP